MNAWKLWETTLVLAISLFVLSLLPTCNGTGTPPRETTLPTEQSPVITVPTGVTPPVIKIKQELEEQHEMLRALVDAEKGRGNDVSQAELWLDEAAQALQNDDLILAREKLRDAGESLGVKIP